MPLELEQILRENGEAGRCSRGTEGSDNYHRLCATSPGLEHIFRHPHSTKIRLDVAIRYPDSIFPIPYNILYRNHTHCLEIKL
jgi:hypothetical protein